MDESLWVDDFLAYMQAEKGCSEKTTDKYRYGLETFRAAYKATDEGLTWSQIDSDVVRGWMMSLAEGGMKPQSMKAYLSGLRSFYRYLLLMGRITHNPMTRVLTPKAPKALPKFFRDDDINRLLDRLRAQATGEAVEGDDGADLKAIAGEGRYRMARAYLLVLMLYMTGMRISELTGIDVDDIEMSARQVKVTGKRNKQRILPLVPELFDTIMMYLPLRQQELARLAEMGIEADASGAMFLNGHGRRAGISAMSALVKRLTGTVTTQQRRSAHVFRHTFATSMLNQGSDLHSVKELLGHSKLATTEVYTHTNFEELLKAYRNAHPRA